MPDRLCCRLPMRFPAYLVLTLCGLLTAGPSRAQEPAQSAVKPQVEHVLAAQAAAWNQGDLDGFMAGYAKIPSLRFASGGTVTHGWQETLDRYKARYPDRAAMGILTFSDLDTTVLGADAAVAFGRWHLKTATGEPHGLFTLVFRKTADGWRIVADHTSAATPTP